MDKQIFTRIIETINMQKYNRRDSDNRSAIAMIFRCNSPTLNENLVKLKQNENLLKNGLDPIKKLKILFSEKWTQECSLELLFIKRSMRENDRWGGHIAFPGGRQDRNSENDDRKTCEREVLEEIGLDLSNSQNFLLAAQLDDQKVFYDIPTSTLICCPFVYIQLSPQTPELQLDKSEVDQVIWIPFNYFITNPPIYFYKYNYSFNRKKQMLFTKFGIYFLIPTFILPANNSKDGGITSSLANNSAGKKITPADNMLWGLTLRIVEEFMKKGGIILVNCDNQLSSDNCVVKAMDVTQNTIGWWNLMAFFVSASCIGWLIGTADQPINPVNNSVIFSRL